MALMSRLRLGGLGQCMAQEDVRVIYLDLGGDAARSPVVNALDAAVGFVETKQLGHLCRPTERIDEMAVLVHG